MNTVRSSQPRRPKPDSLRHASWFEIHGGDVFCVALVVVLVAGTIIGVLLT